MTAADEAIRLLEKHGHNAYVGEPVSQLEHALQAADMAVKAGAPDSLIAAALVHDIGHLITSESEDAADHGIDTRHEILGETWLRERFTDAVWRPVSMHVAAKRYLCAVDPSYADGLSEASIQSLALQGGPMSKDEVAQFESDPFYADSVRLRKWDDAAKIPGLDVPGPTAYHDQLNSCLL
jgi:phosphonate degradation associated HDIG domain protein